MFFFAAAGSEEGSRLCVDARIWCFRFCGSVFSLGLGFRGIVVKGF